MGILNITPDSFYDGGSYFSVEASLEQMGRMLEEGADFIDMGGASSRPGAPEIPLKEELDRVLPVLDKARELYPDALISVDTYRAKVAEEVIPYGVAMINDVMAGRDPAMFDTVARCQLPYIMMHMQGTPRTMQENPQYEGVTRDILRYFAPKVEELKKKGVNDILLDPGFGFGKTVYHNYVLLKQLDLFRRTGLPVVAGLSRKSMINKVLNIKPSDALNGTTVLHSLALLNGVNILRVHDVKQALEAVKLIEYYQNEEMEIG